MLKKAIRLFEIFALLAAVLPAATPGWLDRVEPVITPAERKVYLSLALDARHEFEENFWSNKSIIAEEYFKRLQYIDVVFGSGRSSSGANTDQGRVYLSIGPPTKVTNFASSRIFVPMEIWYYDAVPGVLETELRLIFYRKNSIGFPRLYSPTVDTIRALLLPEAATMGMFGPNDGITESDIRQNLMVPPAEDEVITAAANVATGIKYSGNDEILGLITSPQAMLGRPLKTNIRSRLIAYHPNLDVFTSSSDYGGSQVDLRLETAVQHELGIELMNGAVPVYQNQLHLTFPKVESIEYTQRLDLLPGSYRVVFTVDGKAHPYELYVSDQAGTIGKIVRADEEGDVNHRQTPFEFAGKQLNLNPDGKFAVVPLKASGNPSPEKVKWAIRMGTEVLWRSVSEPGPIAIVELPVARLAPGAYSLEAATARDSKSTQIVIKHDVTSAPTATLLSYNANLAPASRFAFVAHQWLLRGNVTQARLSLAASFQKGNTEAAQIELARADAMAGELDAARDRVRRVLAANPNHFEALSVFAYIETRLQDYAVAAELYRRALAIQDSPALRMAAAKLPAN